MDLGGSAGTIASPSRAT